MKKQRNLRMSLLLALIGVIAVASSGCLGSAPASGVGNLHILVRGSDDGPLGGAKVISNTQPESQLKITGITQTDGTVTYNDIKAGSYGFYVTRFEYEQKDFSVTVKPGHITEVTVTLVKTP
jgi:hypothetical protein